MRYQMVAVKNVSRLSIAGDALIQRADGLPGIGAVWGETGAGKTTAVTWFVNSCHGVYVRALASWTPSSMLRAILNEFNVEPRNGCSCASMVEQIVGKLAESGRSVFIDEADYIIENNKMTDTLRDLHDLASTPLILIGMSGLQKKIGLRAQLAGRVAQWVEFQPCDLDDAGKLAKTLLSDITVEEDLLTKLHKESAGSIRLLVVGLSHIEKRAKAKGIAKIALRDWRRGDSFFLNSTRAEEGKPN